MCVLLTPRQLGNDALLRHGHMLESAVIRMLRQGYLKQRLPDSWAQQAARALTAAAWRTRM